MTGDLKLWILPVGRFDADVAALTPGDQTGQRVDTPVFTYLVDTGQGLVLLDTGCSRQLMTSPATILGDGVRELTPVMNPARDYITVQLERLGIDPKAIDVVMSSHLHFDHAGANSDPIWSHAEFWIQRAEWEATQTSPRHYPDAGLNPPPGATLKLLDGDAEVAPGVDLVATPGHTPGHQSLMVRFATGSGIFITSDAVYTRSHYDVSHLGAAVNRAASAQSVARIQQLCQEHDLHPFFSHDPHQVRDEGWQLAPFAYHQDPFPSA